MLYILCLPDFKTQQVLFLFFAGVKTLRCFWYRQKSCSFVKY